MVASLFVETKQRRGGVKIKKEKEKQQKKKGGNQAFNCFPEVQRGGTLTSVQKSRQVSSKERAKGDRNLIFHL